MSVTDVMSGRVYIRLGLYRLGIFDGVHMLWILLPDGLADGCCGSSYTQWSLGKQICAVDAWSKYL
jgi:hypothetical protein